ncbi:hypothetical protein FQA39_LY17714 [Lamprigera yunnana]|nr:hypothetical protein FQA39_LY17714 [Lamprigera yunnana]
MEDAMQHVDDGDTVQFVDINSILLSYQSDSDNFLQVLPDDVEIDFNKNINDIILSPHITFCAHSLNLIATKDAEAALDSLAYKKIYRSCFSKIQAFLNLLRQSTLASDIIQEWNFIEEFCTVYEPLAISLDNLQGEKYCFLGCVAPTLSILRCKLQSLSYLTYCELLKTA